MSLLMAVGLIFAPAPAAATAVPTPPAPQDKLVCRYTDDPDLGSHIARRKKVCMLASEWKIQEALIDNSKRRMQERPLPTIQGAKPSLSGGN
jgi:hypothetical protein